MRVRPTRRSTRRRTGGAILAITAMLSMVLVTATTSTSSAAAVSTSLPSTCRGLDAATNDTLALAKGLIGSDTVAINLNVTAADIPAAAGLDQEINAAFNWSARVDQTLVDKSVGLIPAITIKDIGAQMLIKGPSSEDSFSTTVPGPISIAPELGVAKTLDLGVIGGPITTTGGGIITYRVGTVNLKISLSVPGAGDFNLNLGCTVDGSNLIAKTTVKDPDAPTFTPEVIPLSTTSGGTATVNLLNGVITPGKTPLLPESLAIVEPPSAGTASITNGVFSFTAPQAGGTYSTTVQICGAPKAEAGTPGISEVQTLTLGENWSADGLLAPRPVAFSLKVGDEETALIWTAKSNLDLGIFTPVVPLAGIPLPTPENWAPEKTAGIVGNYAFGTHYSPTSAAAIQAALEALPSIGVGNVVVAPVKGDETRPNLVTAFTITYVGALAEQDVPSVNLGQWYSVPPQEVLDSISTAIAGIAGSLGGGGDGSPTEPTAFDAKATAEGWDQGSVADQKAADDYFAPLWLNSIISGTPLADGELQSYILFKLNLGELIPKVSTWLNSLFPQKIAAATTVQGEAAEPPQPLCAQGIIDVTVTEVAGESVTSVASVAGTSAAKGIGFVG